jgi:hypothetical protein
MSSVYDDSDGQHRLEPAGRLTGAELLVASDSATTANPHFEESAAFGAEFKDISFCALIRGILTLCAPLRIGKDFQSIGIDRIAADLAKPCLLPIAVIRSMHVQRATIVRPDDGETEAVTRTAGQPVSIDSQELAHQLGRRMRRSPQQSQGSQSPGMFIFTTDRSPAANLTLQNR